MTGTKYWSLGCSYLDFNGEDLGWLPIELKIAKFRGIKHINALEAFPLQYHAEATTVRADLLECGRKFMSLRGTHHRYCNGSAFYVRDGQQVEVRIDSRIMVDAAYFRKMNPNYFRPTVLDLDHRFDFSASWDPLDHESSDEASSEASLMTARLQHLLTWQVQHPLTHPKAASWGRPRQQMNSSSFAVPQC